MNGCILKPKYLSNDVQSNELEIKLHIQSSRYPTNPDSYRKPDLSKKTQ